MHTAICVFDDRDAADRAVERLVQEGYPRRAIHVEFRDTLEPQARSPVGTEGQQPEEPGERGPLEALGHFFVSLFGRDHPSGHARTYHQMLERGHAVLVLDTDDAVQAKRAHDLLATLQAREMNVVERRGLRPLHEVVGMRPASGDRSVIGQSYGPSTADTAPAQAPARERTYDTERATAGDLQRTAWSRDDADKPR